MEEKKYKSDGKEHFLTENKKAYEKKIHNTSASRSGQ